MRHDVMQCCNIICLGAGIHNAVVSGVYTQTELDIAFSCAIKNILDINCSYFNDASQTS
jgi:hypothetical protein